LDWIFIIDAATTSTSRIQAVPKKSTMEEEIRSSLAQNIEEDPYFML
jgi:hypothetical protein